MFAFVVLASNSELSMLRPGDSLDLDAVPKGHLPVGQLLDAVEHVGTEGAGVILDRLYDEGDAATVESWLSSCKDALMQERCFIGFVLHASWSFLKHNKQRTRCRS